VWLKPVGFRRPWIGQLRRPED